MQISLNNSNNNLTPQKTSFKANLAGKENISNLLQRIDTFECIAGGNPTSMKQINGLEMFDRLAKQVSELTNKAKGEFELNKTDIPGFFNIKYNLDGKSYFDEASLPMMPEELKPDLFDNGVPFSYAIKKLISNVMSPLSKNKETQPTAEELQKVLDKN